MQSRTGGGVGGGRVRLPPWSFSAVAGLPFVREGLGVSALGGGRRAQRCERNLRVTNPYESQVLSQKRGAGLRGGKT